MSFKSRIYASAVLVSILSFAPFASASAQTTGTTTVFPPTNVAAGGGLLYFPQGGPASLYAVPVLSDPTLDTATQAEGTQLAALVTATNNMVQQLAAINATLAALAKVQGTTVPVSSGSSSSSGTQYVAYPDSIKCDVTPGGGMNTPFTFAGLSHNIYSYTTVLQNDVTTTTVTVAYDAVSGAFLSVSGTPTGDVVCPSILP